MLQAPVELNNAAWRVYSWSKDKNMLAKALLWSQQSIELAPKPEYYDTLAHLLYRLKFYNEAESMQLRAVELAPRSSTSFQKELTKIKKRQL